MRFKFANTLIDDDPEFKEMVDNLAIERGLGEDAGLKSAVELLVMRREQCLKPVHQQELPWAREYVGKWTLPTYDCMKMTLEEAMANSATAKAKPVTPKVVWQPAYSEEDLGY